MWGRLSSACRHCLASGGRFSRGSLLSPEISLLCQYRRKPGDVQRVRGTLRNDGAATRSHGTCAVPEEVGQLVLPPPFSTCPEEPQPPPCPPEQHPEITPMCTSLWLQLEGLPGDVPGTQEPSRGMPCRACAFAAKQVKKVLSPRSGLAPAAPGSPGSAGTLPGTKDGAQGPHPERSVPGWCHKAALCPQGGRPRAGEPAPLLGGTGARSSPFPWPPHTQLPMPGTLGRVTGVG